MKTIFQIIIFMFLCSISLFSQSNVDLLSSCDCELTAILHDPDTTGTNIRMTPNGPIITTINSHKFEGEMTFKIIANNSGWLKVSYDSLKNG
jgi:hypothetical protein